MWEMHDLKESHINLFNFTGEPQFLTNGSSMLNGFNFYVYDLKIYYHSEVIKPSNGRKEISNKELRFP